MTDRKTDPGAGFSIYLIVERPPGCRDMLVIRTEGLGFICCLFWQFEVECVIVLTDKIDNRINTCKNCNVGIIEHVLLV